MASLITTLIRLATFAAIAARAYNEVRQTRDDTGWYLLLAITLHLVGFVSLLLGLTGEPLGFVVAAGAFALAYPWLIARHVLVRLRMWRMAFAAGWLARIIGGANGHGSLIACAWALHRQRKLSDAGAEFLQRRLSKSQLSSAAVLAQGLLISARGDRARAIAVIESLTDLLPTDNRVAHRLGLDFLVADAAAHGEWARLRQIVSAWQLWTPSANFLSMVCPRLVGGELVGSKLALIAWWALAPNRLATLGLLRRALRKPAVETTDATWPPPRPLEIPDASSSLARALALHTTLHRRGTSDVELEELVLLARAWDEVEVSGEIETITATRAADLKSTNRGSVTLEFLEEVSGHVKAMVRDSGHRLDRLPSDSLCLRRAAASLREELLAEIELGFSALEERAEHERKLPPIDEWREFLARRAQHNHLVAAGGAAVRQLAFPQVHHAACNYAVWLWNDRGEYGMANAIFRWLLDEATAVGDERAIKLQKNNCDVV